MWVGLIRTKSSWLHEPLQQVIGKLGHYNIGYYSIENFRLAAFAYKQLDLKGGSFFPL